MRLLVNPLGVFVVFSMVVCYSCFHSRLFSACKLKWLALIFFKSLKILQYVHFAKSNSYLPHLRYGALASRRQIMSYLPIVPRGDTASETQVSLQISPMFMHLDTVSISWIRRPYHIELLITLNNQIIESVAPLRQLYWRADICSVLWFHYKLIITRE